MKNKFIFRPKPLPVTLPKLNELNLKKVDRETGEVFEDDVKDGLEEEEDAKDEMSDVDTELELLQEKIKLNNLKLLNINKSGDERKTRIAFEPKPARRKVPKREIIKGVVMFERWLPIVLRWVNTLTEKGVQTHVEKDAHRIDVMNEGWRMCIMAQSGEEFSVALYYNYETMYNSRAIKVDYIIAEELHIALDFVLSGKSLFSREVHVNTEMR